MNDWIDVNERLPEIGQRVLVSAVVNLNTKSQYRLYFDSVRLDEAGDLAPEEQAVEWWWSAYDDPSEVYDGVTHWKPLEEVESR